MNEIALGTEGKGRVWREGVESMLYLARRSGLMRDAADCETPLESVSMRLE